MLSREAPHHFSGHPNRTRRTGLATRHLLAVLAISGSTACGAAQTSREGAPALRAVLQVANAPLSESFTGVVAGGRFLLFQEGFVVDLQTRKIAHRFPGTRLLRRNQRPHQITVAQYWAGGGIVDLISGRYLCRAPSGSHLEDAVIARDQRTCLLLTREREHRELPEPAFTATVVDLESGEAIGSSVVTGPPGLRGFELRIEGEVGEGRGWSIHARSGIAEIPGGPMFHVSMPLTRHEISLSASSGTPTSPWRPVVPDYGHSLFDEGSRWSRAHQERDAPTREAVPDLDTLAAIPVVSGVRVAFVTADSSILVTRSEGFSTWSVRDAAREATTPIPASFSRSVPSALVAEQGLILEVRGFPWKKRDRPRSLIFWDTKDGSWMELSEGHDLGGIPIRNFHNLDLTACGLTFRHRDQTVDLILADSEGSPIGWPQGRSIARFIEFRDGEWVVLGEDGIYNGSAGATKHVAWFRRNGSLASTEDVAAMRQPEELRRRIRAALDCEGNSD